MRTFILTFFFLCACGETGQQRVTATVIAGGGPMTTSAGLWEVTIRQARVAFGPLYWCATQAASADLCPAATFELAASAGFDAAAGPLEVGQASGVTGEVRSVAYDYGISWRTTDNAPAPTSGALDGAHSAIFAGTATTAGRSLDFTATLDVLPQLQGTYAVQGARSRASITGETVAVMVTARPDLWFAAVDFDSAAAADAVSVDIAGDSVAGETLRIGMTANVPLSFVWEDAP